MEPVMSLYYFHLRNGEDVLLDPEGRELSSMADVAAASLMEAREIISHDAKEGRITLSYHLDVEDRSGTIVHCLDFEEAVLVTRGATNDRR
jgi:hypothetical protein